MPSGAGRVVSGNGGISGWEWEMAEQGKDKAWKGFGTGEGLRGSQPLGGVWDWQRAIKNNAIKFSATCSLCHKQDFSFQLRAGFPCNDVSRLAVIREENTLCC